MYNAISHHMQASIAHRTKLGGTVHSALAHWYTLYLIIPQTSKAHCNALFKVGWYSALVHNVPSQQSPVYQDYQVVHCASIAHRTRWHSAPYSTVVQCSSYQVEHWTSIPHRAPGGTVVHFTSIAHRGAPGGLHTSPHQMLHYTSIAHRTRWYTNTTPAPGGLHQASPPLPL